MMSEARCNRSNDAGAFMVERFTDVDVNRGYPKCEDGKGMADAMTRSEIRCLGSRGHRKVCVDPRQVTTRKRRLASHWVC